MRTSRVLDLLKVDSSKPEPEPELKFESIGNYELISAIMHDYIALTCWNNLRIIENVFLATIGQGSLKVENVATVATVASSLDTFSLERVKEGFKVFYLSTLNSV
ncbi:hypothetical protein K3495_g4668 [Podosphaera aphanis]|nr:hypothetical protein K3495_g4668 [Podosphaera aphanis]